jgi:hypothetical protein
MMAMSIVRRYRGVHLTARTPRRTEFVEGTGVSRIRISQIMDLLNLAPSIQEEILLMPRATGRDLVTERQLRGIVTETDWSRQMEMWDARPRSQ